MSEQTGECSTCCEPLVTTERASWTVRVVRETLRFRPDGGDTARPIRIAAGKHYVFCPTCSALLEAGRFRALADRLAAQRRRRGLRVRASATAEATALLMTLAARLTPPLSDEEIVARWPRRVGVS